MITAVALRRSNLTWREWLTQLFSFKALPHPMDRKIDALEERADKAVSLMDQKLPADLPDELP